MHISLDQKTEDIIFQIFQELANIGKIVLVVNHDLGESISNFDDLNFAQPRTSSAGKRQTVFQEENLYRAYGSKVSLFSDL